MASTTQNPFINSVQHMDCVDGFDALAKDKVSVDLIIADPPYVISRESNFHTMKDRKKARTGTDFGDWDKEFDNIKWLTSSYGSLKPGGALLVFNDFKKVSEIINQAQAVGFEFKDVLVWEKTNPMPRNRDRRYVPSLEVLLWFVKVKSNSKWVFNKQSDTYQSPVLRYPSESGGGFKRYHPTQKPVKLIEKLIRIHSNPGDLILDPFMGSGTTAIACINQDRNYTGFEIDEEYFKVLSKRIKEYEPKPV